MLSENDVGKLCDYLASVYGFDANSARLVASAYVTGLGDGGCDQLPSPGGDSSPDAPDAPDDALPARLPDTATNTEAVAREVIGEWNRSISQSRRCGRPCQSTPARVRAVKKLLRQNGWDKNWREALHKVSQSDFLTGQNSTNWRATLDWFLRYDNYCKIMEGNYDRTGSGPVAVVTRASKRIAANRDAISQALAAGNSRHDRIPCAEPADSRNYSRTDATNHEPVVAVSDIDM